MLLHNTRKLRQDDFKNEKELQTYFETNLKTILNYIFIDTEFSVGNFRIDTLAFDEETKSFRIIEYKNVKNYSLIDQGYTYLKLMLERKADFVLQYNLKKGKSLTTKDIDWNQSKVIFVSPKYTQYQLNASDFKNLPIDLIKVTKYEGNIIDIDFIQKNSNIKVEDIYIGFEQKEVNKEVKVYTEEDHFVNIPQRIRDLYENLKERILELGDIDIDVKKIYIAFKGITNIVDVEIFKNYLVLTLNIKKGKLKDPFSIAEDISNIGHHGNGDYRVFIKNEDEIDNVIYLIKQSLQINKK